MGFQGFRVQSVFFVFRTHWFNEVFLPGPYVVCTSEWALLRPHGAVLLSKNTLVGAPSYGVHGFCLTWVLDGSDNFIRSYTVEAVNCKDIVYFKRGVLSFLEGLGGLGNFLNP